MVLWSNNLYISENIKKKKDSIIASINNRKATYGVFCIAFASQSCNLFDIMDANELLFPYFKKADVRIVGLAKGKEDAIKLAHDMVIEVYKATGEFDVRTYFT